MCTDESADVYVRARKVVTVSIGCHNGSYQNPLACLRSRTIIIGHEEHGDRDGGEQVTLFVSHFYQIKKNALFICPIRRSVLPRHPDIQSKFFSFFSTLSIRIVDLLLLF